MKIAIASILASLALVTAVSAQTPPRTPTAAECAAGFNDSLGFTREQFVKACAEMNKTKP